MDEALTEAAIRRLRVERDSTSDEVLRFWHDHGKTWALQEGSFQDIKRLAEVGAAARDLGSAEALSLIMSELKLIWKKGFSRSAEADAYGWDEMNDHLPAEALAAFVQGVEAAWGEVKDRL